MSDELKVLANTPTEFEIAGRKLSVTPMRLLQALRAQEVCEPFLHEMGEGKLDVSRLLMRHATQLYSLVQVMLNEDSEWLANLSEDQFDELLGKLMDVNRDFFVRRMYAAAMSRIKDAQLLSLGLKNPTPTAA